MRRADRLFQIVQLLRSGKVVTAARLAEELEVSERTIYRDVGDLVSNGVPIEGEAGVGYCMPRGFDLPPLMFSASEIEALVLGVRMVESWSDPALASAARGILSKVENVLPDRLRARLSRVDLYAPGFHVPPEMLEHLGTLRTALTEQRKLTIAYTSASGENTQRTLRPLALHFWGLTWTLVAWCELRDDFRTFRPDRIRGLEVLDDAIPEDPDKGLEAFYRKMASECEEDESCS